MCFRNTLYNKTKKHLVTELCKFQIIFQHYSNRYCTTLFTEQNWVLNLQTRKIPTSLRHVAVA